jgi:hypothetical protein
MHQSASRTRSSQTNSSSRILTKEMYRMSLGKLALEKILGLKSKKLKVGVKGNLEAKIRNN